MSAEVDRRRSDLCESNELSHYEKFEAKKKDEAAKAVRKKINDELQLELMAEVDRKRVTKVDKKRREKLTS